MQNSEIASAQLVRTIRLADSEVADLLDGMVPALHASSGRGASRYSYRIKSLVVHLLQPGSATSIPYLVPTRDISSTGLSFLHGGYVHMESKCLVQLITSYGTWDDVPGIVRRCSHVQGSVHIVGIEFDKEIDPSVYAPDVVARRVLVVDGEACMARLIGCHLGQLNAQVDYVESGVHALEKVTEIDFDAIFLDVDSVASDEMKTFRQLRESGYGGFLVGMSGSTDSEVAQRCLDGGANRFLTKPFGRDEVEAVLAQLCQEPLFSKFHNDASMHDILVAYGHDLQGRARKLEIALSTGDVQSFREIVSHLKVEGGSYGFDEITEAANTIERGLAEVSELSNVASQANLLVQLCTQARASLRGMTGASTEGEAAGDED